MAISSCARISKYARKNRTSVQTYQKKLEMIAWSASEQTLVSGSDQPVDQPEHQNDSFLQSFL